MDQNEALVQILPEIKRAAMKVGREWGAVTTPEDIEQSIVMHLLEKNTAVRLFEFDAPARRELLEKIGQQLAVQERVDYDYFTGNFRYSTREVRELLERGALYEERTRTRTERLDLDEGSELLRKRNARYAEVIADRYLLGNPASGSTARKDLTRAVDLLTDCMNQVHKNRERAYEEGPGTRTVLSNAQAMALTSNQYAGSGTYGNGGQDSFRGATGEF